MAINDIQLIVYIFCILICKIHSHGSGSHLPKNATKSVIQKLRDDLLKNYDKGARPAAEKFNATEVFFYFDPIYVLGLDEENHILSLEAWISLQWTDRHLAWNPNDYSGLYAIQFAPHEIWKPDISVYSSVPVTSYNPTIGDAQILSFNNGELIWVPPASINSYCELDYTFYPLDVQQCKVVFGSWTHKGEVLNIDLHEGEMDLKEFFNTNQKWEIIGTKMEKVIKSHECCPQKEIRIVTTLKIKRKQPSVPKQTLKGPSLLATFFTLLMFWLPSTSCQKINLGCASLIILSICLLYIGKAATSSMAILITADSVQSLLHIVAAALIMEIIIVNVARISEPCKLHSTLTKLLHSRTAKLMLILPPKKKRYGLMDDIETDDEGNLGLPCDAAQDWFLMSTALDRLFFLVYLTAFITHASVVGP